MATSCPDDTYEIHFKLGSCNVVLKQGNLLDEKNVDAIVIPTPSIIGTEPDSFALFKAACSTTDHNNRKLITNLQARLTLNEPDVLSINNLGYIFTIPPYRGNERKARKLLKDTYTSCLELAIEHNYKTISFPTIGCGIIGFKIVDAAKCIYSAIQTFCETKSDKKMNEIRIVVFDTKIYDEFVTSIKNCDPNKKVKFSRISASRENSNLSEMPSGSNTREPLPTPRSVDDDRAQHGANNTMDRDRTDVWKTKEKSRQLNPDSPDFRPSSSNKRRILRQFVINNYKTEIIIVQGDILTIKLDAIVNAANESMLGGGGVDGVIHKAAGYGLLKACTAHKQIYPDVRLPTGRSRILLSYDLKKTTHYIINTAGPCYGDAPPDVSKKQLISCYETSLALANLYDLESIGFTAISCGIFRYPLDEGAEVALTTVASKADSLRRIWFVLKDDKIYDAWVKKAEELNFVSIKDNDDDPPKGKMTNTKPSTQRLDSPKDPSTNNDSRNPRTKSTVKSSDESLADDAQSPPESARAEQPRKVSSAADRTENKSSHQQKADTEGDNNSDNGDKANKDDQSERKKSNEDQTKTDNSSKKKKDKSKKQSEQDDSTTNDEAGKTADGVSNKKNTK